MVADDVSDQLWLREKGVEGDVSGSSCLDDATISGSKDCCQLIGTIEQICNSNSISLSKPAP